VTEKYCRCPGCGQCGSAEQLDDERRKTRFLRSELRLLRDWIRRDSKTYPGGRQLANSMIARIENALKEKP
jgi:hypothetical protein